jgi:hypothetical protein
MDKQGKVLIGDAFTLFTRVPGANQGLCPPYDCQMTVIIDQEKDCYFYLRVLGMERPGVRIDFQVRTVAMDKKLSLDQIYSEMSYAHEVILEKFEVLFTDGAKKIFERL